MNTVDYITAKSIKVEKLIKGVVDSGAQRRMDPEIKPGLFVRFSKWAGAPRLFIYLTTHSSSSSSPKKLIGFAALFSFPLYENSEVHISMKCRNLA